MAKKKKKVPLRTIMRRLVKKADKVLSLYVRKETIRKYKLCPFCKVEPITVCFHFVRRARKSVRWLPDNTIGACGKCNFREYRNPDPYRAFYIREFGVEKYLAIVDKSQEDFTPTIEYLEKIIETYDA